MESILVAFIGGTVTLAGVFASNSRSKALTCVTVNTKPRGQKRKLRGAEFTFEFVYLSQNCPREYSKAQLTGLRHSATLVSTTQVINMFHKQATREQRIPFEITARPAIERSSKKLG